MKVKFSTKQLKSTSSELTHDDKGEPGDPVRDLIARVTGARVEGIYKGAADLIEYDMDFPSTVSPADAVRVRRVLMNVLKNRFVAFIPVRTDERPQAAFSVTVRTLKEQE